MTSTKKFFTGYVEKREDYMPLPPEPHLPPLYDDADIGALKALKEGTAEAHQQQRALFWIVQYACGAYATPYVPGDSNASHFAMGKQFAGQQIVKLLNLTSKKQSDSEHG